MSADKATPKDRTAIAREFGAELRKIRSRAGLSGHELARTLGWAPPKVSMLETGVRGVSAMELGMYLGRVALGPREINLLTRYAGRTVADYRSQRHGNAIPDQLHSLAELESTAETILTFDPALIPRQLQSEGYMRELLQLRGFPAKVKVDRLIEARIARQSKLGREGLSMAFYFPERAIHALGDREVMHQQIRSLLLAARDKRCELRIITDPSFPVGAIGGMFSLFQFSEKPSIVYAENQVASLFLEDSYDIRIYQSLLRKLEAGSLPGKASLQLLEKFHQE